jgi:hypothetical protein
MYLAWRAGTTIRVVEPARHAGNRFLDSLKGIQIPEPVFVKVYGAQESIPRVRLRQPM